MVSSEVVARGFLMHLNITTRPCSQCTLGGFLLESSVDFLVHMPAHHVPFKLSVLTLSHQLLQSLSLAATKFASSLTSTRYLNSASCLPNMARMTTRSMTARGEGIRQHLLALPAEVRALILHFIFIKPTYYASPRFQDYGDVHFAILWTCQLLRREAMIIFASRIEVTLLDLCPEDARGPFPVDFLRHLRSITLMIMPDERTLRSLKSFKALQILHLTQAYSDPELDLPEQIGHRTNSCELDDFVLTLPELLDEQIVEYLVHKGCYEELDLPFDVHHHVHATLYFDDSELLWPGCLMFVCSLSLSWYRTQLICKPRRRSLMYSNGLSCERRHI